MQLPQKRSSSATNCDSHIITEMVELTVSVLSKEVRLGDGGFCKKVSLFSREQRRLVCMRQLAVTSSSIQLSRLLSQMSSTLALSPPCLWFEIGYVTPSVRSRERSNSTSIALKVTSMPAEEVLRPMNESSSLPQSPFTSL